MKVARDLFRVLDAAGALTPALRARVPEEVQQKRYDFLIETPSIATATAEPTHDALSLSGAGAVIDALGAEVTVLLLGPPGIGKSALVDQLARRRGMRLSVLQCPQLAPEDVLGLPFLDSSADSDRRRVRFAPPEHIVPGDGRPVLLLVDELASAPREVQRALHQLLLDRRVGEHALPQGSIVVGASNRIEDGAFAMALSTAVINRLLLLHVRADFAEWVSYAAVAGVRPEVLAFLRLRPEALLRPVPDAVNEPLSSPRSWTTLSRSLSLVANAGQLTDATRRALARGAISPVDAADFCACAEESLSRAREPSWVLLHPRSMPREGAVRWLMLYGVRDALTRDALGAPTPAQLTRFFASLGAEERVVLLEGLTEQWARAGALQAMATALEEMIS